MPPFACQSRPTQRISTNPPLLVNFGAADAGARDGKNEDGAMTTPDDRLTTLEMRAAEQEKTIEELSGQIAEQWKTIEGLRKRLDALTDRFLVLEEQAAPEVPVTRPPHW
jgi:SlyX protein